VEKKKTLLWKWKRGVRQKRKIKKRMRCNKLRYDGALSWIARRGQYYELNWAERGGGGEGNGFCCGRISDEWYSVWKQDVVIIFSRLDLH